MNSKLTNFKLAVTALGLGAGLMLASDGSANAQGQYDPYHGQRTYHGRDYDQHQKNEKEDLKAHQRYEREQYRNDADLRYHQQQEREELKRHQRDEKNTRKS